MKTRLLRLCWVCRLRIAPKAFAEPVEQPPPEPGATAVVLDHADASFFELSFAVTRETPRATEHPEQESR